jgi:hypothetical protein
MRFFSVILLLAVAAASGDLTGQTAQGALSRGPYLQKATVSSVVVVWRTRGAITPVLRIGDTPGNLTTIIRGADITLRASVDVDPSAEIARLYQEPAAEVANRESDHDPSTPPNTFQYEATVSGLESGSSYYYAIYNEDRLLAGADDEHHFNTHPSIGSSTKMRVWVVGDSGTGGEDQARVHESMRTFVEKTGRKIDHFIHVGDMAYGDGTDREFQAHFFEPYQSILRNTVCWPAMGNHEGHTSRGISGFGPYYDAYVLPTYAEAGGVASGTEAYYSFDISGVHFICLDSHDLDRSADGAMAQWLRADLEKANAQWLVAFWHHPPYTKGSHDSDRETQLIQMRENFMPILEASGVDLTLTGHSHIYERSMLMDGAYATPTIAPGVILDDGDGDPAGNGGYRKSAGLRPHEGSVSVVAGHGGTTLGRKGTMPVMRQIILEHGSVLLDIDGDTLTGIMLNKNGETRDVFSIVKQGTVTPRRVENPWQPVHDVALLTSIRLDFKDSSVGAAPAGWQVATGAGSEMVVTASSDQKIRMLRAQSAAEPLIGIYTPWTLRGLEYETSFRLSEGGARAVGLVFGYKDPRNYFRVLLDAAAGVVRTTRITEGVETVLDERSAQISIGPWLHLAVEAENAQAEIHFEDEREQQTTLEFAVPLGAEVPPGSVGFYLPANSTVEFRTFEIEHER